MPELRSRRASQREIRPTAVSKSALGDIVQRTSLASASSVVADSSSTTFSVRTFNSDNRRLFAGTDWANYVGSVAVANELPTGSNVTESDYQVIGPYRSLIRTDGNDERSVTFITNNSGGQVTLLSTVRARYVINQGGIA